MTQTVQSGHCDLPNLQVLKWKRWDFLPICSLPERVLEGMDRTLLVGGSAAASGPAQSEFC